MNTSSVRGWNRGLGFGGLVLAALGLFADSAAAQFTWNNATGGSWQTGGNWTPGGPPGASDTAIINIATSNPVTMSAGTTIGTVTVNNAGATLNTSGQTFIVNTSLALQAGTLTTSAGATAPAGTNWNTSAGTTWNWTGGTLSGGTFTNGGTLVINGSGLTLNAPLVSTGTVNWVSGSVITQSSASISSSGLFDIQGDGNVTLNIMGTATFTNTGTLRKSAGTGTTTINSTVVSTAGVIDVQTGTLAFLGGSSVSGTVSAAAGATVNLGGVTMSGTLTGSGTGTVQINGASIGSGVVTLNYAGNRLQWSNGTLTGSGTLTIPSGAQLNFSGSGNKILNGTLNIAGTFLTTATGPLMMNAGSSVTNSGLFSMQADNNVFLVSGSTGSLTNTGVLRKSAGTGTTTVNYPVVNSAGGTISVQTGILAIGAAGPPATGLTFNGASSLEITGGNTANTSLSLPNVVTQGPGAVLTIKVTDDGTLIKTGSQVYNWTVITGAGTNLTSLGLSAFAVAGGNVPITNASVSLLGSDVRITFTPVPEPAGLLLAAGAAWAVRRRRAV